MEASLTCAVCLSLFEDPVTLPRCSHNFCRTCVVACLGQGPRAAEQPGPGEAERDAADADAAVSVACPLCRKVCALPGRQGAAALPVNTTLAEVVKLFKGGQGGGAREAPWAAGDAEAPLLAPQDAPCRKHPGRPLQLFCRMCCRPACGQCVSEEHQGVFHAVGPIGTLYQEEKLSFFNCLKEIRKLHGQLVKEVAACQNDMETQVHNEEEIIKREFEKISKTLEVKKKQLLDSLASRKEKREKEYEIWKKTKDAYRKTIEKYLNECEKIVNECDPQCFLTVACNLNHRMKTQIDLIEFSSHYENLPGYKEMHMDTTSIINSIFALHLTPVNIDAFKAGIPCLELGNTEENSEEQKKIQNTFNPVAGIDVLPDGRTIHTRLMSISEIPEFGRMSHEEVRYNYYIAHQVHSCNLERQKPASPLNRRHIFPESSCSSIRALEAPLFVLSTKASKPKPQVLQRQCVSDTGFSKSLGYVFSTPTVNLNFSGSNNNLNLFNVKGSPKDSQKTVLSENTDSSLTKAQVPLVHAALLSFGPQTSLTVSPDLHQVATTSVAVLNPCLSDAVKEHSAPVGFSSLYGKGPTPSLKNEKSSTLLLEKPESPSSNLNKINGCNSPTSTVDSSSTTTIPAPVPELSNSGKPFSSAFSTTPENVFNQPNKPHSSLSLPVQSKTQENQICFKSQESNIENCSGKKVPGNFNLPDSLPYKTSGCVPWEVDASKEQPAPDKASVSYFWETNATPVFSLPSCIKNNQDSQTSSATPAHKTKNPSDKLKKKSNDPKKSTVEKSVPSSNTKQFKTHSSSFFFTEKLKSESILVPQENVAHDSAANQTSFAGNIIEQNNQLENPPKIEKPKEDHIQSHSLRNGTSCIINAESDGENLSQASK